MDLLKSILFMIFMFVSYKFYTKYNKGEHDGLVAALKDFESTECPFGISLYRLKTLVHAYRIQLQTKLPHNLTQSATILKRCEMEPIEDEALPSEESPDGALSEYQTMGDLVSYEFDQSCDTVQYRVRQDDRPYLANNALMSNFIVAYLLQVVKWPDPVVPETSSDSDAWSVRTLSRGIFPGTLWCGFGNVAEDMFGQLGEHEETDNCCRSHDLCKPMIKAFQTRFFYANPSPVPISHCGCDLQFYNCLLKVNSPQSRMIGKIFFNLVKMKCFDFDVREVCTSSFLGLCFNREKKCVAVMKINKAFTV